MVVIQVLLSILFTYLLINTFYTLFFAFAGFFARRKFEEIPLSNKKKFVIFMPTYKGDEVIKSTARKALTVNYPKDLFHVVVIADSLQPATVADLKSLDLQVVEVNFENSTKAKSLKAALEEVDSGFDYAVILDIDNIMEDDFLEKINIHLQDNKKILQAHRVALNTDTHFAVLDAISEEVNNHIFRRGHRAVGLSAAFIGSGKALQFDFYKNFIQEIEAVGGFDKEMELKLLSRGEIIHYAHNALVYDEKVQEASRFQNQRKRWLSAQFHYFTDHLLPATKALLTKGNVDYFDKMMQMVLFPRLLLVGSNFILAALSFVFPNELFLGKEAWSLLFLASAIAIFFSIPKAFYNFKTLMAFAYLPKAFFIMFSTLFKLKGANKKFIHTEHTHVKKD